MRFFFILNLFTACFLTWSASSEIQNRYKAEVVSIYDGDTLLAEIEVWQNMFIKTRIRLMGIDTPEIKGECEVEIKNALKARNRLRELAKKQVEIVPVKEDKYGRVLAYAYDDKNRNLNDLLLNEGLARKYIGWQQPWC